MTGLLSEREKDYDTCTGRLFGCTKPLSAGVRLERVTRVVAILVREVGSSKK